LYNFSALILSVGQLENLLLDPL